MVTMTEVKNMCQQLSIEPILFKDSAGRNRVNKWETVDQLLNAVDDVGAEDGTVVEFYDRAIAEIPIYVDQPGYPS